MTITHVGIIGAGQMGNGIAQVCVAAGLTVTLVDVSDAALERGLASIAAGLDRLMKKGMLSADDKAAAQARIRVLTEYDGLKDVDLVVEAATENLELKLKTWIRGLGARVVELDAQCGSPHRNSMAIWRCGAAA